MFLSLFSHWCISRGDSRWDIAGGVIVGAALGLATYAGGAVGTGLVSGWAGAGLLVGTTGLSFGAGMAESAINQYSHTGQVDKSKMWLNGGITALQSAVSFGIGAAMSYCNLWESYAKNEFSSSIKLGLNSGKNNIIKGFAKGLGIYAKRNATGIVARTVVKNIFTISYSIIKHFIG